MQKGAVDNPLAKIPSCLQLVAGRLLEGRTAHRCCTGRGPGRAFSACPEIARDFPQLADFARGAHTHAGPRTSLRAFISAASTPSPPPVPRPTRPALGSPSPSGGAADRCALEYTIRVFEDAAIGARCLGAQRICCDQQHLTVLRRSSRQSSDASEQHERARDEWLAWALH